MEPVELRAEAEALVERAGACALDDAHVLLVSGDDAMPWLQGQVTQDVGRVAPGGSAYTLLLSPNGKVIADAWVHRRADDVALVVPSAASEALRAQLDAHVIMEDVTIAHAPDLAVVTVQGPRARALRAAATEGDVFDADRLDTGAGFDVLVPRAEAERVLAALAAAVTAAGGARVSAAGYELARIRRGVPKAFVDFGENTLPQEAGLAKRAVSFTKGCYLGQEPVVMLEHRGQAPKRLFAARVGGDVEPGASLGAEGDAKAGRVTSVASAPDDDGTRAAIVLVKKAHARPGAALAEAAGATVTLVHAIGEPRVSASELP